MENNDLKYLKKHYGEKFAHLCRELFPTILEQEGLLSKIISDHFAPTRSLYEDILPIKNDFVEYIYDQAKLEAQPVTEVNLSPEELMEKAGYILYPECKTEDEIQSFRKYWASEEELCTFRGGRLELCRVWFALKKNVDEIKRENFTNPKRQDEYGTSAISIQFTKGNTNTLSIKNRYNHTVYAPDATFGNNLDNIIPGLTQSFVKTYGLNLVNEDMGGLYLDDYAMGDDGKFYRYNVEIEGVNYCENNYVLDFGRVVKLDNARYVLAENYVIDKQRKKIFRYPNDIDSFTKSIGEIKDITFKTDNEGNRVVVCTPKEGKVVEITLNNKNAIIGYKNPNVTEIKDDFLSDNRALKSLSLPNVVNIGDFFLYSNKGLTDLSLPNVIKIGDSFISSNNDIMSLNLPKLVSAGREFLSHNLSLEELNLQNLKIAGLNFLLCNRCISNATLPKLKSVGMNFLGMNLNLTSLSLPNLESAGEGFLQNNQILGKVYLPELKSVKACFLAYNKSMTSLQLPKLEEAGDFFLQLNSILKDVSLPKLKKAGDFFLHSNQNLTKLDLPNLVSLGMPSLDRSKLGCDTIYTQKNKQEREIEF